VKFKLDENLGRRGWEILAAASHEELMETDDEQSD
jgi:hypothetical protein